MKQVETNFYWEYPWRVLTFANFRKYPNEHASHVVSVDVISRHITPTGLLVTDRLLQLNQPIPSIMRKLGLPLPDQSYFLERSVLDPKTQAYEAKSYNLSMRSFFQAEEVCSFESDPEKGGTLFSQRASFTVSALSYFGHLVEDFAVNRFEANASKGRAGLESVITKLVDEVDWFSKELQQNMAQMKNEFEVLEHKMSSKLDAFETEVLQHTRANDFLTTESFNGEWTSPFHHNPFC